MGNPSGTFYLLSLTCNAVMRALSELQPSCKHDLTSMLLSLEIGCLCVNRLRVHTVDSEGQTQWVFMLSCLCTHMQRLRHLDLQSDTEQKHIHLLHCILT